MKPARLHVRPYWASFGAANWVYEVQVRHGTQVVATETSESASVAKAAAVDAAALLGFDAQELTP